MKEDNRIRVWVIVGLVLLVSLLHYGTPLYRPFLHELFVRFYYLPIFLGALWFGLRGGIWVSLLVTLVYSPHLYMGWSHEGHLFLDKLLEVLQFNIAGPVLGILTDRERMQRTRSQELQNLAALGEAAASTAHEIKNIIVPTRGFLRRLRQDCFMSGQCALYLDILERESARLENMTREMLAFVRQVPICKEPVEINLLFEEVKEEMEELFRNKGVRLVCDCQGPTKLVPLDRHRIHEALVNLLLNALDASAEGTAVRLSALQRQKILQMVVEDEGGGIPPEHFDRIFLPFFTSKSRGTGLGLAITRRIVNEHGGDVRVENSLGKGARFILTIPMPR